MPREGARRNFIAMHMPSRWTDYREGFLANALNSMVTIIEMLTTILDALRDFL